jgi:hypothetical protein
LRSKLQVLVLRIDTREISNGCWITDLSGRKVQTQRSLLV